MHSLTRSPTSTSNETSRPAHAKRECRISPANACRNIRIRTGVVGFLSAHVLTATLCLILTSCGSLGRPPTTTGVSTRTYVAPGRVVGNFLGTFPSTSVSYVLPRGISELCSTQIVACALTTCARTYNCARYVSNGIVYRYIDMHLHSYMYYYS
jgi:hypothetical protein